MWIHRSRTVQVYDLFATILFGNRYQLKQNRFNYVLRRLLDQITQFIMSYDIDYWAAKTDNFSDNHVSQFSFFVVYSVLLRIGYF